MTIRADDVDARDDAPTGSDASRGKESPSHGPATNQTTVTIDESKLTASYANFCRVSSTPEEMILDFGLNPNPYGNTNTTINVAQRIIVNHYTAKRLLTAVSRALQRHEQAFGVLETDVRKRVRDT